jgi:Flp pilus assembly protein TadG
MFARPRSHRPRPGNTIIVVAVLLVVLVGMVAFAVDVGRVAHARTGLQATADAGVLAGIAKVQSGIRATQDFAAGKAEVNKFVGGGSANLPGLTVNDSDIVFGYYDPTAAPGNRFSTNLNNREANAAQVTLRRDGSTNPRLSLSFSSLLGKSDSDVRARATAWAPLMGGFRPGSPVIPYAAQVDYFLAAAGLPDRPHTSPGFTNINPNQLDDSYAIGEVGTMPTSGSDGVKEIVLFGSTQNTPGNFGSVDLGGAGNGTTVLDRQLVDGPSAGDFSLLQAAGKLSPDGSLEAPVALTGDTGLSNGTQNTWDTMIGQNRIIPLYSTVIGTGNTSVYQIVGFAGIRIVDVKLNGNPKKVRVQPTSFYSSKVTPQTSSSQISVGAYAAPKLVIP